MENNNRDSGVGTAAAPQSAGGSAQLAPSEFAPFFLICKVILVRGFDVRDSGGLTNTDDDKWQSTGLAVNRLLREIIRNINVFVNAKKRKNRWQKRLDAGQRGRGFLINSPTAAVAAPPQIKWVCQILDDLYIWTDLTAPRNNYDTLTRRQWIWKMSQYSSTKSETFKAKRGCGIQTSNILPSIMKIKWGGEGEKNPP